MIKGLEVEQAEFDRHAEAYEQHLRENIAITGEGPEFFAEYKIADLRRVCDRSGCNAKTLLDFGAGIGASTPYFSKYFPESKIISADVSSKSLEILEGRYPGISDPVIIDESRLPLDDDSVDAAFTACVFHHIDAGEHELWLKEIRRVVRPGGLFVLFEHNPWNPLTVRAVNTCPFDENAVLIDAREMARRLDKAGWDAVTTRYRLFFPSLLAALRPAERLLEWLPLGGQYSLAARV